MRVLVTGAFGNLGFATVQELLKQGHEVRCFDLDLPKSRRRARKLGPHAKPIWGDITNPKDCEAALQGVDAVIHNAAVLPPGTEKAPDRTRAINVGGTENLLRVMKDDGIERPFVYTSSVSVFGPAAAARGIATAEDPVEATDHYTGQKLTCEKLLRESSLPWIILRIGVAMDIGGGAPDPIALRMMFEVHPDNPLEMVCSRDVALAQANAISNREAWGKTLLIGGGESCRIRQRELWASLLDLLQIKSFPDEAFGNQPYYTCWMDTRESQEILQYQRASYSDIHAETTAKVRLLRPLLRLASPITKRHLLKLSGPWNGDPPKAHWRDFESFF